MSGLLVTWYNGNWGTVCDDVTDCDTNGCNNGYVNVAGGQQLAATVCRELGYTGGEEYNADGSYSNYPIVVDGTSNHIIGCDGTESEFKDCANILFGSINCNHAKDVGVRCSPSGLCTPSRYCHVADNLLCAASLNCCFAGLPSYE